MAFVVLFQNALNTQKLLTILAKRLNLLVLMSPTFLVASPGTLDTFSAQGPHFELRLGFDPRFLSQHFLAFRRNFRLNLNLLLDLALIVNSGLNRNILILMTFVIFYLLIPAEQATKKVRNLVVVGDLV